VSVLDQLAPDGNLEWTVLGSGLGGIGDLQLLDNLADGQRLDKVFHPQVVIRRGFFTVFSGDLLGWSSVRSADTAMTAINFDLAPTLQAAGLSTGLTDDSTVSVTFHSHILPLYASQPAPPLGQLLGQGDPLRNTALFSGTVAGALASSDPTMAELALPSSVLTISIFAVNGVPVVGAAHAAFGDIVTYRMQLGLPLTAAHHVQLTAAAPGLTGAFVFDAVGANPTPPSGHAQFGPSGSYTATRPLVTPATDGAGNAVLRFDFGDIQPVYGSGSGTIDVLVSTPLAPGSPLTFTAAETEANSFGTVAATTAPQAGLTLNEPSLQIQTATVYASNDNAAWTGTGGPFGYSPDFGQFGGVVSSAGLAGEPFADRLTGVDAGDDVTFAIAVQNLVPGAKAYDLMVRAMVPDGFVLPPGGASITVTDGTGTPLAYSGNLFDPQGGLALDPAVSIAGYDPDSGLNVLLISYTLRTADQLDLSIFSHVSTAQIVRYATETGWANRVPPTPVPGNTATTEVVSDLPSLAIVPLATGSPGTAGAPLTLGETAAFRITATLPEGLSRGLDLFPVLPAGFTAVSARVVAVGANITPHTQAADGAGGIAFGDTLNAPDGTATADDQVQIEVTVRATGTPGGPAPHSLAVQAAVSIGTPGQVSMAAAPVLVSIADPVPPAITLALASPGPATLWNGQVATFRATVMLPAGVSTAFRILDSLPAGLDYLPGSARIVQAGGVMSGAAALSAFSEHVTGPLLTLDFGPVDAPAATDRQVLVELQARVSPVPVGTILVNSVTAETGYASSVAATLAALVGNTPPVIEGLPAAEATRDDTVLAPFSGIAVTDPDGQQQSLRITVSTPANGILTNSGTGRYDPATGVYTVTGAAAAVAAAAAALRFMPVRHQASLGQQIQTDLSVQVQDSTGAMSPVVAIRVTTAVTNTAPVIHDAAPGQPVNPGTPVRLFAGLMLQDADVGQVETLTIQFASPAIGMLSGTGPGRYDPAAGTFTSTGTLAALTAEAGRLLFTAGSRSTAAETPVTITLDDGAGGIARDTSVIAISASALSGPLLQVAPVPAQPFAPAVPSAQLFIGPAPATVVIVAPAGPSLLVGTGGRDAYFMDGNAAGPQWDTLTGFGGGDAIVLWGFQAGVSSFTWSDNDGPPSHTGRTLRADIPGTGSVTTSLTFAGAVTSDTDRFAVSTGRFDELGYLSIASPS